MSDFKTFQNFFYKHQFYENSGPIDETSISSKLNGIPLYMVSVSKTPKIALSTLPNLFFHPVEPIWKMKQALMERGFLYIYFQKNRLIYRIPMQKVLNSVIITGPFIESQS